MTWRLVYTKQAQRDARKLAFSGLRSKAEALLAVVAENPFQNPPLYEKLVRIAACGGTRSSSQRYTHATTLSTS